MCIINESDSETNSNDDDDNDDEKQITTKDKIHETPGKNDKNKITKKKIHFEPLKTPYPSQKNSKKEKRINTTLDDDKYGQLILNDDQNPLEELDISMIKNIEIVAQCF
eukprot:242636_1